MVVDTSFRVLSNRLVARAQRAVADTHHVFWVEFWVCSGYPSNSQRKPDPPLRWDTKTYTRWGCICLLVGRNRNWRKLSWLAEPASIYETLRVLTAVEFVFETQHKS